MGQPSSQVSSLLRQWSGGDQQALEQLVPIVYKELRRLAHYHLDRERDGHTLQTTAVVHEAIFVSAARTNRSGRIGRTSSRWPRA